MNDLNSENLSFYLLNRLKSNPYPFESDPTADGKGIIVAASVNRVRRLLIIRPEMKEESRGGLKKKVVSLSFKTDFPDDPLFEVSEYLRANVDEDKIFYKGNSLYSQDKLDELTRLRSLLKRVPGKGKMECEVLQSPNNKTLECAVFDYMLRPAVCMIYSRNRKPEPNQL
jgi:hypothetical protein